MTTENTTPESECNDTDELGQREWSLIEQLSECADVHEKAGERCFSHRAGLVGQLMATMGMDLSDLGFIAEAFLDFRVMIEDAIAEDTKKADNVIQASEAFNQ